MKIKMHYKKAVSHIEMVISFGMFVLFVFFLLAYLNPIRNQDISGVLLDAVQNGIEINTSLQLIEMPLKMEFPAPDCFKIINPFDTDNRDKIMVKDKEGNIIKFSLSGENINIEKKEDFYYLYFADAMFNTPVLDIFICTSLNVTDYSYAVSRTYNILFMPRLQDIENLYQTDYNYLREEFNFPLGYDFSLSIVNSLTEQNIITMSRKKPEKVEVFAREMPVEILYEDGRIIKADMSIQTW